MSTKLMSLARMPSIPFYPAERIVDGESVGVILS